MKRFDYESLYSFYVLKKKKGIIWLSVLCSFFAVIFALGIIFSTYENKTVFMVVFSIVLGLLCIIIVTVILFLIVLPSASKKSISEILNGYLQEKEGKIVSISEKEITIKGRSVKEIAIQGEEGITSVYLDSSFSDPFSIGYRVKIKTSQSFIICYEVNDEKGA